MIHGSEGQLGVSDAPLAAVKLFERNGTAHLVQEMPIDVHKEGAITEICNDMVVPNFVEQGSRSDYWAHVGTHRMWVYRQSRSATATSHSLDLSPKHEPQSRMPSNSDGSR